jgi:hypothetical protein
MLGAVASGGLGALIGLASAFLDFFKKKQSHQHELELMKLSFEHRKVEHQVHRDLQQLEVDKADVRRLTAHAKMDSIGLDPKYLTHRYAIALRAATRHLICIVVVMAAVYIIFDLYPTMTDSQQEVILFRFYSIVDLVLGFLFGNRAASILRGSVK